MFLTLSRWPSVAAAILLSVVSSYTATGAQKAAIIAPGSRVGVIVDIPDHATHWFVGVTKFSNSEQASIPVDWKVAGIVEDRLVTELERLGFSPVRITVTESFRAARPDFFKTGFAATRMTSSGQSAFSELMAKNDVKAILWLESSSTQSMYATGRPEREDLMRPIKGYGVYFRQYGFGVMHAYAFASTRTVLIDGELRDKVVGYEEGNSIRVRETSLPADIQTAAPALPAAFRTEIEAILRARADAAVEDLIVR
jgi:hypothetical protein